MRETNYNYCQTRGDASEIATWSRTIKEALTAFHYTKDRNMYDLRAASANLKLMSYQMELF